MNEKPLGGKAYGRIAHLPGSRQGRGDVGLNDGQARICLEQARDHKDLVIVQEKLDGSCVAAAKLEDGSVVALTRKGHPAHTSPHAQHQLWAAYVRLHHLEFDELLKPGERLVGEWLALAHGTRYALAGDEPFVPFDLMRQVAGEPYREPYMVFQSRVGHYSFFPLPTLLNWGAPCSIDQALRRLGKYGHHGAIDPAEGVVYRVERDGQVDFLAKYVRPTKRDGCYLPVVGLEAIWNWRPD